MFFTKEENFIDVEITIPLNKRNVVVSEKTTLKYMQKLNLKSKTRARENQREDKDLEIKSENLINRNWISPLPKQKIYTDITQIKVKEGWLYLSVTLDGFNNEVIDYKYLMNKGNIIAISNIRNTLKKIKNPSQTIIRSDHGREYTSNMFNDLKAKYNFKHSMGKIGNALDNRPIEYFFSILKQEYLKTKEIWNYKEWIT